jgi:TonB family protein
MLFLKRMVLFILAVFTLWPSLLPAQIPPPPIPEPVEFFWVVWKYQTFPGCGLLRKRIQRQQCQQEMFQRFFHDNLAYPELAKKENLEGTAVARFRVERNGILIPENIVENPGLGIGKEAMRLLHLMKNKGIQWGPESSSSRVSQDLFQLSVEFRLQESQRKIISPVLVLIRERPAFFPPLDSTTSVGDGTFRINLGRNRIPLFPGGNTSMSLQEQQQYTSDQLREYFKANFKHQNAGVHLGGKGDFVLRFIVENGGRVSTPSVNRDPGGGIAAAAIRVIDRMVKEDMRWLSGKKDQFAGAVEVSIPISLIPKGQEIHTPRKLQAAALQKKRSIRPSSPAPPSPPPPPPNAKQGIVQLATMLEEPPLFPGCEDLGTYLKKQQCAAAKFEEFLQGNLRYPKKALERGVEGTVLMSFIVEKNGRVSNAIVLHSPGSGTGKEALRLVNLMNAKGLKFSPQKSGGRAVRVLYTLPVKFKRE